MNPKATAFEASHVCGMRFQVELISGPDRAARKPNIQAGVGETIRRAERMSSAVAPIVGKVVAIFTSKLIFVSSWSQPAPSPRRR